MHLPTVTIILCLLMYLPVSSYAQEQWLAFHDSQKEMTLTIKGQGQGQGGNKGQMGARGVAIPVLLYTESDVKVEVINALGHLKFSSEARYPAGHREIKVGMNSMRQGLYFIRVTTYWDEQSKIVILEKTPEG
ncbi:MAG: hypothetical protein AAFR61_17525 [Bacteroidota bacterium]